MDVRVAVIRKFDRAAGSPVMPAEVIIVPERLATRWISEGKVVYYSEFSNSLISDSQRKEIKTSEGKVQRSKRWKKGK